MRKRLSLVFVCLACVLILLQLSISLIPLLSRQADNRAIHSISLQEKPARETVQTLPQLDFKQLAEDMASERY